MVTVATLSTTTQWATRSTGSQARTLLLRLRARSKETRVSPCTRPGLYSTNAVSDTKQTRIVKKTIPTPSFFDFFNPASPPSDEDEEVDDDIEAKLELDYQLGEDIKEKLIPRAIDWFTGEALQFEQGFDDDFDEDEFEDEDDEDDEDLDRDEDDEEESEEEVGTSCSLYQNKLTNSIG